MPLPSTRSWLGLVLVLLPAGVAAQTTVPNAKVPPPIQFGQPNPADFEAKNFVADSTAAAVVLCDYGNSRFDSAAGDMVLVSERTTRVKILKKAGYDYATVEVPLYHTDKHTEELSGLHGFTYLRGADGKITKTKLDADQTFTEKRTGHLTIKKFTLPGVQEGAVLEYTYVVRSTFFNNYQDWTFQHPIPTRWSEYRSSIPQVYQYQTMYHNAIPLATNEVSVGSVNLLLAQHVRDGAGVGIESGTVGVGVSTEQHRWIARNVPAFREEPYSAASRDYLPRISFELQGTQMPNEKYRDLTESWTQKNKTLLEEETFGRALADTRFLEAAVQPLLAQYPDFGARATAVRELVLKAMKYDGTNTCYASGPLKRGYELHRGTSADVNLMLIGALRQAGISTVPLLLSTRAHGAVSEQHPTLEQFNYVVALVTLPGGQELLLDATEPLLPPTTLPRRCLTKVGHTVVTPAEGEGRWVSLLPSQRHNHYQDVKLQLDAQGNLTGQVRDEQTGYAALEARTQLQELGEKKYVSELPAVRAGWEVPGYQLSGQTDVAQPLALRYELRRPSATPGLAQEMYLNPLVTFGEGRNPFNTEQRTYPVDFGMMQQETIMLTLTLPPGYTAELPKAVVLLLPDQGGRYLYTASSPTPGTVQLMSRLTLDKPVYGPEAYQALRELYRQLLAKQAEALVVKKL